VLVKMVNITFFTIHSLGKLGNRLTVAISAVQPEDPRLAADGIEACAKRNSVRPNRRRGYVLLESKNHVTYIFDRFIGLQLSVVVTACSQWASAESLLQRMNKNNLFAVFSGEL
jgi:hypothetical protein